MRVYTELVYGHIADKPAPDTSDHNRKCSPYPFAGEMAVQSVTGNFLLSLEGLNKVHVFSTGEPQAVDSVWCRDATAVLCILHCCSYPRALVVCLLR